MYTTDFAYANQFSWSHWVCHIQVHLYNPYAASDYLGQYKIMQKYWKMIEPLAHGYSSESTQWGLSNESSTGRVKPVYCIIGFSLLGSQESGDWYSGDVPHAEAEDDLTQVPSMVLPG